jgi:hypothetical protein
MEHNRTSTKCILPTRDRVDAVDKQIKLARRKIRSPAIVVERRPAKDLSGTGSSGAKFDRKSRADAIIARKDKQFAANLLYEQLYDFHSKSFAIRRIESRW